MEEMINKHKKSQIIEQKLKAELQSYIDSLPKDNIKQQEDYNWRNNDTKNNTFSSLSKYSIVVGIFIFGLLFVSAVKNETRSLEKEIDNLITLNNAIKFNLEQAILDNEVITSPKNISKLAQEYLNTNLISYKKSQIMELTEDSQPIAKIAKIEKKDNGFSNKIKAGIGKEIKKKKTEIKKLQKLYSSPKSIPAEIKTEVAKKIKEKKIELKNLYSDPKDSILQNKTYRWAAVQVVKLFLGIPVVPGR